ncbi:MAG: ATP-grasp domain-containing protein [Deltaproteobacteria bacterium]|nr:ATP-grasp domain-containing protein [Deltaproteobacteria bacterium]
MFFLLHLIFYSLTKHKRSHFYCGLIQKRDICIVLNSRHFYCGVTDQKLGGCDNVVEFGHMFPADIEPDTASALIKHVTDALTAIGYSNGVAHVEVRLTPQGWRLIEINPRIGGNYISKLVESVTGISPLTQMIQIALGEAPAIPGKNHDLKRPQSAAVAYVLPSQPGFLSGHDGRQEMECLPGILQYHLGPAGKVVSPPDDNDCYLGYVICVDSEGLGAGRMASKALSFLKPQIDETSL